MRALERNLRLYPAYQIARNGLFWMPVFFLYFQQVLSVDRVLLLEAVYYAGVVALEVPSGYFSDRVGRRLTLILSATAWTAGSVVFAVSSSFGAFAAAQLLMAAGMSFNSGTDTALLYDSLAGVGRAHEIGEREGRAQTGGYLAMAVASLAGGIAGGVSLRSVYVLSAAAGAVTLALALGFCEPPRATRALAPLRQVGAVVRALRDRTLAWLFAFWVALVVFEHVPYELVQPYLALLFGDVQGFALAPAIAGALMAATLAVSALASSRAMRVSARVGPRRALLGGLVLLCGIIAAMAVTLHPALVVAFVFRGVPVALALPITSALIHPRIDSGIRATYLSVQSLAGRLAFAGTLALGSQFVGGARMTPGSMRALLVASALALAAAIALLALVPLRAQRE